MEKSLTVEEEIKKLSGVIESSISHLCNVAFQEKEALLIQYKKAVDASSIVSKTNLQGIITFVNDKFCEISGYTPEELIGKNHNIVRHSEMPQEAFAQVWQTIQSGKIWQGVVKNLAKDGSTYIVDATIMPIIDHHGQIIEYIGIRKDITEQLAGEKLLEEYKKAVDASSIVSKTNPEGFITFVNKNFCDISGYTAEELIGKNHNIVRHPEMPKEAFADVWATIQDGRIWQGIVKNLAKDGSTYIVDATIVPIMGCCGTIIEYIGLRKDITQMIKQEEEIANLRKQEFKRQLDKAFEVNLDEILSYLPIPATVVDTSDCILAYNSLFSDLVDTLSYEKSRELVEKQLLMGTLLDQKSGHLFSDSDIDYKELALSFPDIAVNHLSLDNDTYDAKISRMGDDKYIIAMVKQG